MAFNALEFCANLERVLGVMSEDGFTKARVMEVIAAFRGAHLEPSDGLRGFPPSDDSPQDRAMTSWVQMLARAEESEARKRGKDANDSSHPCHTNPEKNDDDKQDRNDGWDAGEGEPRGRRRASRGRAAAPMLRRFFA